MFKTIPTLSQETRTPIDTDGDGTPDRFEVDTDGDGTIDRIEFDRDNNGNIEQIVHLDDDGRWGRVDRDVDEDGNIDRITHYAFDDDGNRRVTQREFDDDDDGKTDRSETYTYDANGNRTGINFDLDDDGTIDRSAHLDAEGRWERVEWDEDDDGFIDLITHYAYDEDGTRRVTRRDFDDDDDGNIDRRVHLNEDGRWERVDRDDDDDGTIDRSEAYTYYANGRVRQIEFDDDGDGTTDRIETYYIYEIERDLSRLDGSNGFILNGIDASDYSGQSVSSAGDVNGDGYDDLIIGAYRADQNGSNGAGETYLVYGGASAPGTDGVLDLSALDGTNGFILTGIDAGDQSGRSVSSAGDVNGDGYDDLIIGARKADPNGNSGAGETYVIYGGASAPGTGGVLDLSDLDGTNGFILNGFSPFDRSGISVSSAGDVNGDGYDDLIIGAYWADPNGNSSGETYVVYGGANAPGTGGVLDLSDLDGTNGFILNGIDAGDRSGFSVSSAGDVNGDGYDDLIIGAFGANSNRDSDAGETYLVYGGANASGTGGVLDLSDLDGTNGFTLTGIDRDDRSGQSVSSAGDVNGDGYDDLIIGASRADGFTGETYVIYGGASAPGTGGELDLSTLDGTNGFTLTGIDAGDRSGFSVSSAGDINGDGYDDLIIGAFRADPNGDSGAGETYVVYGGASAPGTNGVLDLGALDGTNGFILTGIDVDDQSGFSVSSAGDVNGDGYDDLIIGARGADPNGNNESGETYIVYGGATGTESLTPVTAQGMAAADNFTGNAGDDSFTAIATDDVVRGGAGNDIISVTALDFAAIDGGTGTDRLVLDGVGLALDLTSSGNAGVDSVEIFDLSGTGANSLVLDALAVFDVTEERAGGVASLDVLGDADDRVDLSGSNFALTDGTAVEDGVTYNVYRDGNAEVRVEDGVMVTLAATGSQSAESKIDTKTDTGIDPVADPRTDLRIDLRTDPGTDTESGTIRLDNPLMNDDLWDSLWVDGVKSLDQPVHIDEDSILIPLSDPLSFGPLASGPLPGPWGDLIYWPELENHPAMQNDLAMILPEIEIVTADMEGF